MIRIDKKEALENIIEENLFSQPFMIELFDEEPEYEFDHDTHPDTDDERNSILQPHLLIEIKAGKNAVKEIETNYESFISKLKNWAKKYELDSYVNSAYTTDNEVTISIDIPNQDDFWEPEKYMEEEEAAKGKKIPQSVSVGDFVRIVDSKDPLNNYEGKVESFWGDGKGRRAVVFITSYPPGVDSDDAKLSIGESEMIKLPHLVKINRLGGEVEYNNSNEIDYDDLAKINVWGLEADDIRSIEEDGNFDSGGHWNFSKVNGEYEAVYDGNYMHVFANLKDLMTRENEIDYYDYDSEKSEERGEETFVNKAGKIREYKHGGGIAENGIVSDKDSLRNYLKGLKRKEYIEFIEDYVENPKDANEVEHWINTLSQPELSKINNSLKKAKDGYDINTGSGSLKDLELSVSKEMELPLPLKQELLQAAVAGYKYGVDRASYIYQPKAEDGYAISDGDLSMLNDKGFTIDEMEDYLRNKFPDSFRFRVYMPKGRGAELVPDHDKPLVASLRFTSSPTTIFKEKLYFSTERRSAKSRSRGLTYRTYQGGENTYFDFVLIDDKFNEYVGTFGFKDDGDVSPEYITRFVAFLHEAYGFPFTVKHTVAKDGKKIAPAKAEDGLSISEYKSIDNMFHPLTQMIDYFKNETSKIEESGVIDDVINTAYKLVELAKEKYEKGDDNYGSDYIGQIGVSGKISSLVNTSGPEEFNGKMKDFLKELKVHEKNLKSMPDFIDENEPTMGRDIIFNVTYFNSEGKEIDSTLIDEKDEDLAWSLFKELGHTKEPRMYLEWEEVVDEAANGKYVGKGELVWRKLRDSEKSQFLYENFTPQITPRTQELLVGKTYNFLPKNVKIALNSKYANIEEYANGGGVGEDITKAEMAYIETMEHWVIGTLKNPKNPTELITEREEAYKLAEIRAKKIDADFDDSRVRNSTKWYANGGGVGTDGIHNGTWAENKFEELGLEKFANGGGVDIDVSAGFKVFKQKIEDALFAKYAIVLKDTGFDDTHVKLAMENNETIDGIVDRIGNMYELTPVAATGAAVKNSDSETKAYICTIKDRTGKEIGSYPLSHSDEDYVNSFLNAIGVKLKASDTKEVVESIS